MAVEVNGKANDEGLNVPESTGAVKGPEPETTATQVADPAPAGNVDYGLAGLGETVNPAAEHGGKAVADPLAQLGGPVTVTTSWLSEAEAKVVTKQHADAAAASVKEPAPKTSAKAQTKGK